jgi:hypothetical protein
VTIDRFKRKLLGLSIGERGLLVAEVACAGPERRVARLAEFAYPAGMSLEQPEALGAALGTFLRERGFSTHRAVLGVPARWLLLKSHALPPSEPQVAAAMLWLRAEAESAPELGEMVLDFAGQSSVLNPTTALLMGLPKRWLDRLLALATGAGLNVLAVTPSAGPLGAATALQSGNPYLLSLGAEGTELACHEGEQTRSLRHLGSALALGSLVGELRRVAVTNPMNATGPGDALSVLGRRGRQALVLWDDVGVDGSAVEAIEAALDMPVVRGELQTLGAAGAAALPGGRVGAAAVALTLPLLSGGGRPAVDFLHPRLSAPRKAGVTRRTAWMTAAAAVVALAALLAYTDLARIERQVAQADHDLQVLEPTLKTARPFVANMQFVETFQGGVPRHLACLRDITTVVPSDGQTYLTNFHLQSNMKGDFAGRCPNNQEVLNLMDKLNAGGRFTELKRKLDAKGTGPEVSFSVTFTYVPLR